MGAFFVVLGHGAVRRPLYNSNALIFEGTEPQAKFVVDIVRSSLLDSSLQGR